MDHRANLRRWRGVLPLLLAIICSARGAIAPEYYVACDGDDANPGSKALPFKTIKEACRHLTGRFGALPLGGVTVWIRDGIYRETVRPSRPGTERAPIRFAAYPGEEPVISGADVLDLAWTRHSGDIYRAPTDTRFEQLFVDGQMMQEARWPNTSVREPVRIRQAACDQGTNDRILVDNDLPPGDWNGAYVQINPSPAGWSHSTKQITNYIPGRSFEFGVAGWFDERRETKPGDPYWLFGALAGLDRATEWFLDWAGPGSDTVYLWCPGDPNPAAHRIEVKQRDHAFDLSGCHHINIEGLRMFAGGVNMDDCSHCTVVGCHLRYPVHRRIVPPPVSADFYLKDSNYMTGAHNEWRDCAIAYCGGAGIDDRGAYNTVTNCIIHDVDYTGAIAGGISSTHEALGCEYTYNTIRETGHGCIEIYVASALRVEHNDTYNSCLLGTESGPIWAGWTDGAGTTIAYNLVHDCLNPQEGEGIVLKIDSRNYRVHHNLIWNIPLRGIKLNSPSHNNEVYNNTILSSCGWAFWTWGPSGILDQRGCRFINNIANARMSFGPIPLK